MDANLKLIISFLALVAREGFTIDKNKDGDISFWEILSLVSLISAQTPGIVPAFKAFWPELKTLEDDISRDDDRFDLIVDHIFSQDFTPDNREEVDIFVKKTLRLVFVSFDWVQTIKSTDWKVDDPVVNFAAIARVNLDAA